MAILRAAISTIALPPFQGALGASRLSCVLALAAIRLAKELWRATPRNFPRKGKGYSTR